MRFKLFEALPDILKPKPIVTDLGRRGLVLDLEHLELLLPVGGTVGVVVVSAKGVFGLAPVAASSPATASSAKSEDAVCQCHVIYAP